MTTADVMLGRTSVSFDASGREMWLPPISGASISIATIETTRDPEQLTAHIASRGVTVAQLVPSLLAILPLKEQAHQLTPLLAGGEPLSAALASQVTTAWDVPLINLYGPTETTIQVTRGHCRDGDTTAPIGRPVGTHGCTSRMTGCVRYRSGSRAMGCWSLWGGRIPR